MRPEELRFKANKVLQLKTVNNRFLTPKQRWRWICWRRNNTERARTNIRNLPVTTIIICTFSGQLAFSLEALVKANWTQFSTEHFKEAVNRHSFFIFCSSDGFNINLQWPTEPTTNGNLSYATMGDDVLILHILGPITEGFDGSQMHLLLLLAICRERDCFRRSGGRREYQRLSQFLRTRRSFGDRPCVCACKKIPYGC